MSTCQCDTLNEHSREEPSPRSPLNIRRPTDSSRRFAETLLTNHWESLVQHAQVQVNGDAQSAEDLVADVIKDMLAGRFRSRAIPDEKMVAFAKGVIRNRSMHVRRRSRRHVALDQNALYIAEHEDSPAPRENTRLSRALESLTPAERSVLTLRFVHGRSIRETADLRECSPKTVKELCRRAKHKLAMYLATADDRQDIPSS